jgi:lipoprotein NlpI
LIRQNHGDKKTEANAYIGLNLSLSGKGEEAVTYLQWVKENGNRKFVEYALALSELNRIGKAK